MGELGGGSVVYRSGVPERQGVALPANSTEGRVSAFCDLVAFVHQPHAETVWLVASGLELERTDHSMEGDNRRLSGLLKM